MDDGNGFKNYADPVAAGRRPPRGLLIGIGIAVAAVVAVVALFASGVLPNPMAGRGGAPKMASEGSSTPVEDINPEQMGVVWLWELESLYPIGVDAADGDAFEAAEGKADAEGIELRRAGFFAEFGEDGTYEVRWNVDGDGDMRSSKGTWKDAGEYLELSGEGDEGFPTSAHAVVAGGRLKVDPVTPDGEQGWGLCFVRHDGSLADVAEG